MRRYIMEIVEQGIVSYTVEGMMDNINFYQMKPEGEEYYPLTGDDHEQYHQYWEWWTDAVALLSEDKVDICVVYEPLSKDHFEVFFKSATEFNLCVPVVSDWTDLEVEKFFKGKKEIKNRSIIKYDPFENRIIVDAKQKFLIGGIGEFQLKVVAEKKNTTEQCNENKPKVIPLPEKNTNIKVCEKNSIAVSATEQIDARKAVDSQDKNASVLERATSEDLQNYIEKITENQCKTIDLRR